MSDMPLLDLKDPVRWFWSRVDMQGDGCWEWRGNRHKNGYGRCQPPKAMQAKLGLPALAWAHRVAFTLMKGAIPAGMTVDHVCHKPDCCNPAHLKLASKAENSARKWFHVMESKPELGTTAVSNVLPARPRIDRESMYLEAEQLIATGVKKSVAAKRAGWSTYGKYTFYKRERERLQLKDAVAQSKRETIIRRIADGETFESIAKSLGVSRQRVHQLIQPPARSCAGGGK